MSAAPIEAISAALAASIPPVGKTASPPSSAAFPNLLLGGVTKVNQQVLDAQSQATAFALDDSVPVHQVTYALEQARLSMELMLQVRSKLVDGFQELMRMQL